MAISAAIIGIIAASVSAATAVGAGVAHAAGAQRSVRSTEDERQAREDAFIQQQKKADPNTRVIGDRTYRKVDDIRGPRTVRPERRARVERESRLVRDPRKVREPRYERAEKWVEVLNVEQTAEREAKIRTEYEKALAEHMEAGRKSAMSDTADPKANVSILSTVANIGYRSDRTMFGDAGSGVANWLLNAVNPINILYNTIDSLIWDIDGDGRSSLIQNIFIDPFIYSDNTGAGFKAMGLNMLIGLGQDMDVLSNPFKGIINDGALGFARGLGLTGEGRYVYNFDIKTGNKTGDFFANLGTELLVSTPTIILSASASALSAGAKAGVTGSAVVSKELGTEAAKAGIQEAAEIGAKEGAKATTKRLTRETAEKIIQSHGKEILGKTATEIKNQAQELLINSLGESLTHEMGKSFGEGLRRGGMKEILELGEAEAAEQGLRIAIEKSTNQIATKWTAELGLKQLPRELGKILDGAATSLTNSTKLYQVAAQVTHAIQGSRAFALYQFADKLSAPHRIWTQHIVQPITGTIMKAYKLPFKAAGAALGRIVSLPAVLSGKLKPEQWLKSGSDIAKQKGLGIGGIVNTVSSFITGNNTVRRAAALEKALGSSNIFESYDYLVDILNMTEIATRNAIEQGTTLSAKAVYKYNKLTPVRGENTIHREMKRRFFEDINEFNRLTNEALKDAIKRPAKDAIERATQSAAWTEALAVRNAGWESFIQNRYKITPDQYILSLENVQRKYQNVGDLLTDYRLTNYKTDHYTRLALADRIPVYIESGVPVTLKKIPVVSAQGLPQTMTEAARSRLLKQDLSSYTKETVQFNKVTRNLKKIPTIARDLGRYTAEEVGRFQIALDSFQKAYTDSANMFQFLDDLNFLMEDIYYRIDGVDTRAIQDAFKSAWLNLQETVPDQIDKIFTDRVANDWAQEAQRIFNNQHITSEGPLDFTKLFGTTATGSTSLNPSSIIMQDMLSEHIRLYLTASVKPGSKLVKSISSFPNRSTFESYINAASWYAENEYFSQILQQYGIAIPAEAKVSQQARDQFIQNLQSAEAYARLLPDLTSIAVQEVTEKMAELPELIRSSNLTAISDIYGEINNRLRKVKALVGDDANDILGLHARQIQTPFEEQVRALHDISSETYISDPIERSKIIKKITEEKNKALYDFGIVIKNQRVKLAIVESDYRFIQALSEGGAGRRTFKTDPIRVVKESFQRQRKNIQDQINAIESVTAVLSDSETTQIIKLKKQLSLIPTDADFLSLNSVRDSLAKRLGKIFRANKIELSTRELSQLSKELTWSSIDRIKKIKLTQSMPDFLRPESRPGKQLRKLFDESAQTDLMSIRNFWDQSTANKALKFMQTTANGDPTLTLETLMSMLDGSTLSPEYIKMLGLTPDTFPKNFGELVNSHIMEVVGVPLQSGDISISEAIERISQTSDTSLFDTPDIISIEDYIPERLRETLEEGDIVSGWELIPGTMPGTDPDLALLQKEFREKLFANDSEAWQERLVQISGSRLGKIDADGIFHPKLNSEFYIKWKTELGEFPLPTDGKGWQLYVKKVHKLLRRIPSEPSVSVPKNFLEAIRRMHPRATEEQIAQTASRIYKKVGTIVPGGTPLSIFGDPRDNTLMTAVYDTFHQMKTSWRESLMFRPEEAMGEFWSELQSRHPRIMKELNLTPKVQLQETEYRKVILDYNNGQKSQAVKELTKVEAELSDIEDKLVLQDTGLIPNIKQTQTEISRLRNQVSILGEQEFNIQTRLAQSKQDLTAAENVLAGIKKPIYRKSFQQDVNSYKKIVEQLETELFTVQGQITPINTRINFLTTEVRKLDPTQIKALEQIKLQMKQIIKRADSQLQNIDALVQGAVSTSVWPGADELGNSAFKNALEDLFQEYSFLKTYEGNPQILLDDMLNTTQALADSTRANFPKDQVSRMYTGTEVPPYEPLPDLIINRKVPPYEPLPREITENLTDAQFASDIWKTSGVQVRESEVKLKSALRQVYGEKEYDTFTQNLMAELYAGRNAISINTVDVDEVALVESLIESTHHLAESAINTKHATKSAQKVLWKHKDGIEELWKSFRIAIEDPAANVSELIRGLFKSIDNKDPIIKFGYLQSIRYFRTDEINAGLLRQVKGQLNRVLDDLSSAPWGSKQHQLYSYLTEPSSLRKTDFAGSTPEKLIRGLPETDGDLLPYRDSEIDYSRLVTELEDTDIRLRETRNINDLVSLGQEQSYLRSQLNDFYHKVIGKERELYTTMMQYETKNVLPKWETLLDKYGPTNSDKTLRIFTKQDKETFLTWFFGKPVENQEEFNKQWKLLKQHLDTYDTRRYTTQKAIDTVKNDTLSFTKDKWVYHRNRLNTARKRLSDWDIKLADPSQQTTLFRVEELAEAPRYGGGDNPILMAENDLAEALLTVETELENASHLNYYGRDLDVRMTIQNLRRTLNNPYGEVPAADSIRRGLTDSARAEELLEALDLFINATESVDTKIAELDSIARFTKTQMDKSLKETGNRIYDTELRLMSSSTILADHINNSAAASLILERSELNQQLQQVYAQEIAANPSLYKLGDTPITPTILELQDRINIIARQISTQSNDQVYDIISKSGDLTTLYENLIYNSPNQILIRNGRLLSSDIELFNQQVNQFKTLYEQTKNNINLIRLNDPNWQLFGEYQGYFNSMGIQPEFLGGTLIDDEILDLSEVHKTFRQSQVRGIQASDDFVNSSMREIFHTFDTPDLLAEHLIHTGGINIFQMSKLQHTPGIFAGTKSFTANGRLTKQARQQLTEKGIYVVTVPTHDAMIVSIDKSRVGFLRADGVPTLDGKPLTRRWTNARLQVDGYEHFEQIVESTTGRRLGYSQGDIVSNSFINDLFRGNKSTGWTGLSNIRGLEIEPSIIDVTKRARAERKILSELYTTEELIERGINLKTKQAKVYTVADALGGWSNEDLISEFYFSKGRFNEMIYGDIGFNQQFGIYRTANPKINAWKRAQDLMMTNRTRTNLTLDMLDASNSTKLAVDGGTGVFAQFTNEQIYEHLLAHPEHTLVMTYAGAKGQGLQVRPFMPFFGPDSLTAARAADARLMTVTGYKQLAQVLNKKIHNNLFLHVMNRIFSWYKTGLLMTNLVGMTVNNWIDTNLKTYVKETEFTDKVSVLQTRGIYNEYQDILNYLSARGISGEKNIQRAFQYDPGLRAQLNYFKPNTLAAGLDSYEAFMDIERFMTAGPSQGIVNMFQTADELNTSLRAHIDQAYRNNLSHYERLAQQKTLGLLTTLSNDTEQVNRLSMYLTYLKNHAPTSVAGSLQYNLQRNAIQEQAYSWVRNTHFDYAFKSGVENALEHVIPFSTFLSRNIEFWWKMASEHPEFIYRILQVNQANWSANGYTPEELHLMRTPFMPPIDLTELFNPTAEGEDQDRNRHLFLSAKFSSFGDVFNTVFNPVESLKHRIALPGAQVAINAISRNYKNESQWSAKDPVDKVLTAASWLPGASIATKINNVVRSATIDDTVGALHHLPGIGATSYQLPKQPIQAKSRGRLRTGLSTRPTYMRGQRPTTFQWSKARPPRVQQARFRAFSIQRSQRYYNDSRPRNLKRINLLPNNNLIKQSRNRSIIPQKSKYTSTDKIKIRKLSGQLYGINVNAFRR